MPALSAPSVPAAEAFRRAIRETFTSFVGSDLGKTMVIPSTLRRMFWGTVCTLAQMRAQLALVSMTFLDETWVTLKACFESS